MKEREPAKIRPAGQKTVKSAHRRRLKVEPGISLKQFVKTQASLGDKEFETAVKNWIFNKHANTSKPPLGLGATRKKKGAGGKK